MFNETIRSKLEGQTVEVSQHPSRAYLTLLNDNGFEAAAVLMDKKSVLSLVYTLTKLAETMTDA